MDLEDVELLSERECRRLLGEERVGRVAVSVAALPAVFPVNYVVASDEILFFTGEGTKLRAATDIVTVDEDATVIEAAAEMMHQEVRHLLVRNHRGQMVGLVSMREIISTLLNAADPAVWVMLHETLPPRPRGATRLAPSPTSSESGWLSAGPTGRSAGRHDPQLPRLILPDSELRRGT